MNSYGANQLYNIGDYTNLGLNTLTNNQTGAQALQSQLYGQGQDMLGQEYQRNMGTAQGSLNQQLGLADAAYGQQQLGAGNTLDVQRQLNAAGVLGARANNATDYNQLSGQIQRLGLDQTSNYINQIARPQINQQMALQGLEGGGAPNAAIARATAEYGMPIVQQLAGLAQQYQGLQGGLNQQYLGGEQQAGGQYAQALMNALAQRTQGVQGAGQQYGSNVQGIGQQQTAQQAALQQQYANTLASLSGQYNQNTAQFLQGIPGAQATFQQAGANTANALFPLADYARSLQAQDLNRRQGLFGTTLTGLPYTPGGTTSQDTSKTGLFGQLTGIGSPSSAFGKGTGSF
jgi:hypothetical protein